MSDDEISYDLLTLDALRGVVRTVLQRVQRRGLPGEHHFYITFNTQSPGVSLSKRLKEIYPEEMTIVLQHQFRDLQVNDERFEVRLFFNNIPERLVVPFAALKGFLDPSVQWGLSLGLAESGQLTQRGAAPPPGLVNENAGNTGPDRRAGARQADAAEDAAAASKETKTLPAPAASKPSLPPKTADVVDLDRFRKK